MESNLKIIEKLAKSSQKVFREHNLEQMDIHRYDWEDLERKGFLIVNRSKPYPEWDFYLSRHAYEQIDAKKSRFLQKWGIILIAILSTIAIIIAIASFLKP